MREEKTATEVLLEERNEEHYKKLALLGKMFGDCITFYDDGTPKINGSLIIKRLAEYL